MAIDPSIYSQQELPQYGNALTAFFLARQNRRAQDEADMKRAEYDRQQQVLSERKNALSQFLTPAVPAEYALAENPSVNALSSFMNAPSNLVERGNVVSGYPQRQAPQSTVASIIPEVRQTQAAAPGKFNYEGARGALTAAGDLEGAKTISDIEYKDALGAGGGEKWFGNGQLIQGPDGRYFQQITSNRGNTKIAPIDGSLVGQAKVVNSGGKIELVDPYTGSVITSTAATRTPAQQDEANTDLQGRIAGRKAEEGAIGKAAGEQAATSTKRANDASASLDILRRARALLPKATGSLVGSLADSTMAAFGKTTEGAKNIAQLDVLGTELIRNVPRFEGPQSDADRASYERAAGDFQNPRTPWQIKMARLDEMEALARKYAGQTTSINATPQPKPAIPKTGERRDGYMFLGGNPADPSRWKKVP